MLTLLGRLKFYLAAFTSALLTALGLYVAGRKAGKDAEQVKSTKKAQETERKATDALVTGLSREDSEIAAARARRAARLRDRKQS